jgi:tripartite-type tricarboxylate transporter receptor subunit TctC
MALSSFANTAAYPGGRPIKLIVPHTPGGGTDAAARFIGTKIAKETQWSVVIENRPGAGGNIGMDSVAKSKPDGLLIGLGQTANLAINPALMPKMPFDARKDFIPVVLASLPMVLVVRHDSPANTPAAIVNGLNKATLSVLGKKETSDLLAQEGSKTLGGSPAEAQAYIRAEQSKWAKLIADAKISIEKGRTRG